jgi:hypothetical protein
MKSKHEIYREAYAAAMDADNAWQTELERVFGKSAGTRRYMQSGKSTPKLAALHAEFRAKMDELHELKNK